MAELKNINGICTCNAYLVVSKPVVCNRLLEKLSNSNSGDKVPLKSCTTCLPPFWILLMLVG